MNRAKNFICLAAVAAGTCALYVPRALFSGRRVIVGLDYFQIHRYRLEYARTFILHSFCLPGWYTREFLGTPFWSNIHNFPWIPTHLVLLLFDPSVAYNFAVIISALLAVVSMFFYCRCVRLSFLSSSVSAWTYGASGFFAARVMAGHLPILEAYFSLPLLLWMLERFSEKPQRSTACFLLIAICAVCLTGHPQIPAYAIGTSILYARVRLERKIFLQALKFIAQAIVMSSFAWIPMLLLIARSTRVLHLLPSVNNITFPYSRLGAYLFPWKDGWPHFVMRFPAHPFSGYASVGYFWDTVCYVGWLPLISFIACICYGWNRRLPKGPWLFLGSLGVASLVTALPWRDFFFGWIHVTLFRSPSRQIYLLNFSLIVFLGVFLNQLENTCRRFKSFIPMMVVMALIAVHVVDVYKHSHSFISLASADPVATPQIDEFLQSNLHGERVAIDSDIFLNANRRYDDVGFCDPMALALPYRNIVQKNSPIRDVNIEEFPGSRLSPAALAQFGVKFVVTVFEESGLTKILNEKGINLYLVPDPIPRVAWFNQGDIKIEGDKKLSTIGAPARDLTNALVPTSPDAMTIYMNAPQPGFIQFIESWDIGWQAENNGVRTPLWKSNDFLMAVPVIAGENKISLRFKTPGQWPGFLISLLGLLWAFFSLKDIRIAA